METGKNTNYIYNDTFNKGKHFALNACVGNNGSPEHYTYAEGFIDASIQLCELIISRHPDAEVDTFIYPIAFNMRHGVELWLKFFIMQLKRIRKEESFKNENHSNTHDLNTLWNVFKCNALKKDYRYKEPISTLEKYIKDIGEIDPTGQTFRYPYNTDSQKHLIKTPLINVLVLHERLIELKEKLSDLWTLNHYLTLEYNTGSYTSKLNRKQLREISEILTKHSSWRDPSFDELKKSIREKYSLTSNDLSKAINLIKEHHEFAYNIGIIKPLKYAKPEDISYYLQAWAQYKETSALVASDDTEALKRQEKLIDNIEHNITGESLADLYAVANCERCFLSESYNVNLNQHLEIIHNDNSQYRKYLLCLLSKPLYTKKIIRNLKHLKQKKTIEELSKEFKFVKDILNEE